jgi:tetratricopeptide (TPR) repeat protein
LVRNVFLFLTSAIGLLAATQADEATIQRALSGIYDMHDDETLQALSALEAARPGFPTPAVYRCLLAYWRASADPGNPELIDRFRQASGEAIKISTTWVEAHPDDAEGWRYMASVLGQRAQFSIAVAPNKGDIVRYGMKAREAVLKAQTLEPENKDILVGIGAANYFAANIPWYLRPIAYTMGVRGGDRDLGLKQIREGVDQGMHSKVEGAMVLAGAMYTEQNYPEFYKVITQRITTLHPRLLPPATWAITGCLCGGMIDEALQTAQRAEADDGWRNVQLGRIALARKSWKEAQQAFSRAIDTPGTNVTVLAWAYYGRSLARSADKQPEGGDMKHAKETSPAAYELAAHQFRKPGTCR